MKKLLVSVLACALLLTAGCGGSVAAPTARQATVPPTVAATPTDTPTDTPTPTPTPFSFPALGEWVDNLPYSFIGDDFALVIDIQQANSMNNVASITSIVDECVYNGSGIRVAQPYILASSASDTITGRDITISANVAYYNQGIQTIYGMQFVGTLNTDGSLSLASSQLGGVQDYSFIQTTGAVARLKSQFEQATCTNS